MKRKIIISPSLIRNSKQNFVLADSKKSRSTAMVEYATWKNIDFLITDDNISDKEIDFLQKNTTVLVVKTKT